MKHTDNKTDGVIDFEKLGEFKKALQTDERSDATIEKYVRDVRALVRYAGGRVVTKELLTAYKQKLIDSGYAVRSINSMIASVNSFFGFMERQDLKMKQMKLQRQIYRPEDKELTKAEFERLIKAAEKRKNARLGLILQTICATGIRVSELRFITVEAARKGEATVSCKGKTRTVFIVRKLQKLLIAYAKEKGIREGGVFITRKGRPLDRITIWREMKSLCGDAKVNPDKVFPHNLRHLFARVFYELGNDIAKLADVLGHSSINTTRIYIISTGREHKRQMERMRLIC